MRKTPYKHQVKNHTRSGRPVRSYERGKGRKPRQPRKTSRSKKVVVGGAYSTIRIELEYFERSKEKFELKTNRYDSALSQGLSKRKNVEDPKTITLQGVRR